ncbi:MAG: ABC transporter ATP-binding protein [Aristaeellaceae bacterium]
MKKKLLEVNDMYVSIHTDSGVVQAVRGVSFELYEGETLAIVGESGSGKSITNKAIMGLLPVGGQIDRGTVILDGRDITHLSEKQMKDIRGAEISMIFQDPLTSLNPTMTVGKQITEMLMLHKPGMTPAQRRDRAIELLDMVGIPNPAERINQYPHQFSGGMRQRVMISIALACEPKILIADEPTTALDVTIQAQILDLMKELQKKINTSIIIITHNLGVVASVADRVLVMYGGKFAEVGDLDEVFYDMKHPYTRGLMDSIPNMQSRDQELYSIPGSPPDLMKPPAGCPFAPRCKNCLRVCKAYPPATFSFTETHRATCWLYDERAKGAR